MATSLLGVFAILGLVLANAFFVAAEFGLVAVRNTQIALWVKEGRRGAAAAASAIRRLDDTIAATQLGITIASIGLGFVGEPVLAGWITPLLAAAGMDGPALVHSVALAISFAAVTFLHVVAGELAPKAVALDRPGVVSLLTAGPLLVFGRVFRPVLWLMNGAGNLLVRAFGVRPSGQQQSVYSPDEISLLVAESRAAGVIGPYAGRMLANVFRMARIRVRDVMVPRDRMLAIERGIAPEELLDLIKESGFTRIPVYDGELENLVGVLHTKDLFQVYADRRVVILDDAIRPGAVLSPELGLLEALREFRRGRRHLAIVRDGDGPVLGVCTLEDVLEEIVGEIEDEHDRPTPAGSQ